MQRSLRNSLVLALGLALGFAAAPGSAAPMKVRGTISVINGDTIEVKQRDGSQAKVRLADDATVVSVASAKLSDIKPGSFIGTAATPKTDGTLQALEIHIFPESMRGTGE